MTASYLDHFAFTDAPFPAHPDGDRHVVVPGTEDLPERILAAFDSGHALVTLTGPEGTGTTMTARAAAARAPAGTPVALVTAPAPESGQSLLSVVCHGFGLPQRETWAEMTGTLGAFLEDTVARGEHPLLIIDDAQALEVTGLEGVKLLTTLETGDGALLSILLAGRPALHDLLGRSALRPLAQRITLKLETAPLTPEQGHAYIDARLAHVRPDGVDFDPIAPAAKDRIVRAAGGLPPAIDHLCDAALAAAAEDGALVVEDSHVDQAEAALIDRGADATVITAGKPGTRRGSRKERREARRRERAERKREQAEARAARRGGPTRRGTAAGADMDGPRRRGGSTGRLLLIVVLLLGGAGGVLWLLDRAGGDIGRQTPGQAGGSDGATSLSLPVLSGVEPTPPDTPDTGPAEPAPGEAADAGAGTPDRDTPDSGAPGAVPSDSASSALPPAPRDSLPPVPVLALGRGAEQDRARNESAASTPQSTASSSASNGEPRAEETATGAPPPPPAPMVGVGATEEDARVADALARLRALRDQSRGGAGGRPPRRRSRSRTRAARPNRPPISPRCVPVSSRISRPARPPLRHHRRTRRERCPAGMPTGPLWPTLRHLRNRNPFRRPPPTFCPTPPPPAPRPPAPRPPFPRPPCRGQKPKPATPPPA